MEVIATCFIPKYVLEVLTMTFFLQTRSKFCSKIVIKNIEIADWLFSKSISGRKKTKTVLKTRYSQLYKYKETYIDF